jgi:hypothetical protein
MRHFAQQEVEVAPRCDAQVGRPVPTEVGGNRVKSCSTGSSRCTCNRLRAPMVQTMAGAVVFALAGGENVPCAPTATPTSKQ